MCALLHLDYSAQVMYSGLNCVYFSEILIGIVLV